MSSRTFALVLAGETISTTGSQLAGFALGVWLYQRTGSVTVYGLSALMVMGPMVLMAPLAGVIADRFDRRRTLLARHAGAGAATLGLAALLLGGVGSPAAVLPIVALISAFNALGLPAFSATVPLLVRTDELRRANGLVQLGYAASQIIAPGAAGLLLPSVGLAGIVGINVVTFLAAAGILVALRFPPVPLSDAGRAARGSIWHELRWSIRFVNGRPGLRGLLLLYAGVNFNLGVVEVLVTPLVLGFADSRVLGTVLSIGGLGMVAGGAVMAWWPGPRRAVDCVLGFTLLQGLLLLLGAARPSAALVAAGAFGVLFAVPLVAGFSDTIWQKKVSPDVQGRVFALRTLVGGITLPIAYLSAGALADRSEPWMARGGPLASTVGRVLQTGPGRGAALLFVLLGAATLLGVALAGRSPRLRRLELELPDEGERA